jgi:PhnB protein
MTCSTTVHANFRGRARKASTFYQTVFGGELAFATYADIQAVETPETADHIALCSCESLDGSDLMAYQGKVLACSGLGRHFRKPGSSPLGVVGRLVPLPIRTGHGDSVLEQ